LVKKLEKDAWWLPAPSWWTWNTDFMKCAVWESALRKCFYGGTSNVGIIRIPSIYPLHNADKLHVLMVLSMSSMPLCYQWLFCLFLEKLLSTVLELQLTNLFNYTL
jgi:hypothetical protein